MKCLMAKTKQIVDALHAPDLNIDTECDIDDAMTIISTKPDEMGALIEAGIRYTTRWEETPARNMGESVDSKRCKNRW